jgi:hypothetical protein
MTEPYKLTISKVVAATYCEQKVVFDRRFGDARPSHVRAQAEHGTKQHQRFEAQGNLKQATDSKCFIATHVFGGDAPETIFLRRWRDQALTPTWWGRAATKTYYVVSPILIRCAGDSRTFKSLARRILAILIARLAK